MNIHLVQLLALPAIATAASRMPAEPSRMDQADEVLATVRHLGGTASRVKRQT